MNTFRIYQSEADNAIFDELIENDKCLVKMFCGTGKSRLMRYCRIAQGKLLVVYVVPSLSLLEQFYEDYLQDFPSENILRISSEEGSTTESNNIVNFLRNPENKIICITYQSFETLVHLLDDRKIDVCIFDEAHHVVGEKCQPLIFGSNVCDKQIFFTATPKNGNGIVMYDKDNLDAGMCGKLVYDYSYFNGVLEGYLNPFEIRIDFYTENTNASVYESIARAILASGNNRVLTFHADVNGDRDTSVLQFVDEAEFIVAFNKVLTEFPEKVGFYRSIQMVGLSAEIHMKTRKRILTQFDTTPENEVIVVSSCQTIGEGIDTKNANMCVFVDPKSSFVAITQNIGRIVRKNPEIVKPNSTILIPCWVDKTKYLECGGDKDKCDEVIREDMNKGGNFNGILNVMSALKQEDEDMFDVCLNYPSNYSPQEIEGNLLKHGYQLEEPTSLVESLEHLLDSEIDLEEEADEELLARTAEENNVTIEVHSDSLETPIEYYGKEDGKEVIRIFKSYDEEMEENVYQPIVKKDGTKRNADRVDPLRRENRFNVKVHTNPDVKVLWNLKDGFDLSKDICSCIIDCEVVDMWPQRFEELKAFIDENERRPSQVGKKTKEPFLGRWLSSQTQQYKNKTKGMKYEERYNIWRQFLEEYKEYFVTDDELWLQNFEKTNSFIVSNKKTPSSISKNENEKMLGKWYSHNTTDFNNGTMNSERSILWNQMLQQNKILSKQEQIDIKWFSDFETSKQFINTNKKRPSAISVCIEEKNIGSWIVTQNSMYKKKAGPMKDNNKYKLWKQFLEKYKDYIVTKDAKWVDWLNDLERLKIFIDINNKKPSRKSQNEDEKELICWLSHQLNQYKNKKNGMKDEERYNIFTKFLEEYEEYFDKKTKEEASLEEEIEIIVKPKQKKTAKLTKINPNPIKKEETKEDIKIRTKPLISQFHNKFCKMRSDNLAHHFQQNPSDFAEYHKVRDECFKTFEPQDIPCNRVIVELEKIKTKRGGKHVVDMGCGTAKISEHFKDDPRFHFINYDHVAINDTVQVCDISHMPLEDDSVDICVMSLALWGSNCEEYIKEAYRVLETNSTLYIIDSTKRWSEEGTQNATILKEMLETTGFQITTETIDKWCYFKGTKVPYNLS